MTRTLSFAEVVVEPHLHEGPPTLVDILVSIRPHLIVLLLFAIISIAHERNWRRLLADYAAARREAGASEDGTWPSTWLSYALSMQPVILVLLACCLIPMVGFGLYGALYWPHRPPLFFAPIHPDDLPVLWAGIVAGCAAVLALVVVAVAMWRSPWQGVARRLRRSVYAPAEKRAVLFAEAIERDPGVPHGAEGDGLLASPL